MLNSNNKIPFYKYQLTLLLTALFSLYSCLPTSTAPSLNTGSTENPKSETGTNTNYSDPAYPLSGIFVQEGANRSLSNFSLPLDFSDSFLIRGKALSQYLRTIPNTTKMCLVGKYNYISGRDKYLILSAKPKSYTDLVKKTTEFYLQIEPSNDTSNQNDCLSYNLTNILYENSTAPSAHFSLSQLCTDCSTTVTSSGLKLYFMNGEEVPSVAVNSLLLTISGSIAQSSNVCSESTACRARGFDCCLSGQCVTDGALRPGALTLPGFQAAQEDVRLNPDRFIVYPQFYFVCETRPEVSGNTGGGSTTDPDYEASIRMLELNQLYNCINKVEGEFSHCTLKYTDAAQRMGIFSAATDGLKDDVNFSSLNSNLGIGDKANNIVKIIYAGQTIYEQDKTQLPPGSSFVSGSANDDLQNAQGVNLNLTLPANAKDANLYVTYKVDGSCEKVSATLAKCTKTYIHASSDTSTTYWHDSSKVYKLPAYADLSSLASVIVKVSGIVVPEDLATWTKAESPNRITFASSYVLYQNQTVEITYFVKSNPAELTKFRTVAQEKVNTMCSCASSAKCNLKPLMDSTNTSVVNYECTYPSPSANEPPVNQTVYVSNKNIAHRYFDANGVSYDENYGNALDQEMPVFQYTNNDVLRPNNVSQYVGFNEIYGPFSRTNANSAKPAKMVRVKKDKLYDILVNTGAFSSCTSCGSDYYTSLQKIFPQNFAGQGGGYAPDNYETRRENNSSLYRADDLLFGRACFLPATMIPWTHFSAASPTDQRRNRLKAQHFLFANGYNRDWFGFDYGSLIGSFDGVTWFSIGNQRRIKATTSKLYLAVNAYLGDLNIDNNFNVTVAESSTYSSDIPDHDTETDGAQCQKSHFCSNDNDCFRQLGYDYTCQNVASMTTTWPQFDATGAEVVGSSVRSLLSVVGGANGQGKRCIYRGRGAPCLPNLDLAGGPNNFNGSNAVGTLMCSHNNSCLPLTTINRFNDRIARFANTPLAQNTAVASPTPSDTVGLGARVILRPYDYYGTKSAPSGANVTLGVNNVTALCVPGRDVNIATDTYDLNARHPSNRTDSSDKIFGVGPASGSPMTTKALNACPATDALGTTLQLFDLNLGSEALNMFSISQNMSSNLLDLTPLKNLNIFSSTSGSQVSTVGYQRNTCLRAPGASCFTDMECAPSSFIASKTKSSNLAALLNPAEIKYWEEELVCGNPDFKNLSAGVLNPGFDIKKNKCCREFGKTLTVFTQTDSSTHQWCDVATSTVKVAGVNQSISSFTRYSRVHSVYDKMTCDINQMGSTKTFALSLAATGSSENVVRKNRWQQILAQYKTLDNLNQRTCCTGNWVRSFSTENGGGHQFSRAKLQIIDKSMFRDISWTADKKPPEIPFPADPDSTFECGTDQYMNSSCEIKNLTPTEEENYLTWAASLELIGIPQVAIKTDDQVYRLVDENQAASASSGPGNPLVVEKNNTLEQVQLASTISNSDFIDDNSKRYYSAANYTQMNLPANGMKKVFSENEFNCCIPSGQEVPDTTTPSQCCTGFTADLSGQKRCCLPDFTDVTLYLNRYVSSEGRGLSDSAYDPATGYIKDAGQVQLIASQKNLCCSGTVMTGVAISQLSIPLTGATYRAADAGASTRRFNYRTDEVDNNSESGSIGSIFDAGVRWNNHVYCVPAGFGPR
jgi:hypothetical protein